MTIIVEDTNSAERFLATIVCSLESLFVADNLQGNMCFEDIPYGKKSQMPS